MIDKNGHDFCLLVCPSLKKKKKVDCWGQPCTQAEGDNRFCLNPCGDPGGEKPAAPKFLPGYSRELPVILTTM